MSHSLLLAFIVFAVVTLYTPGPNNVMLLTSGLNFGFRRTVPHIAGVCIGFAIMVAAMGAGLGVVFTTWPVLQTVLKYVGAAYLLYLAIAIARAAPQDVDSAAQGQPMTFTGAALFQWVNIKGWVIAVSTITAYAGIASHPWNIAVQSLLVLVIGLTSAVAWAAFGTSLRVLIKSPRAGRVFNIAMAALLVASLYPVLAEP